MAMLQIPIDGNHPDHQFFIDLEGTVYLMHFKLNDRSKRWTMDIKLEDGTLLVAGIPLIVNWPLIRRFKDSRLPPGEFYVVNETGGTEEPREDSFLETHVLIYLEAADVEAL